MVWSVSTWDGSELFDAMVRAEQRLWRYACTAMKKRDDTPSTARRSCLRDLSIGVVTGTQDTGHAICGVRAPSRSASR